MLLWGEGYLQDRVVSTINRCDSPLSFANMRDSLWEPKGFYSAAELFEHPIKRTRIVVYLEVPWKSKNMKFFIERLPISKEGESVRHLNAEPQTSCLNLPTVIRWEAQILLSSSQTQTSEFAYHNTGNTSEEEIQLMTKNLNPSLG